MIKGTTITLRTPTAGTVDRFGNATQTWTESTVDNVLVEPGTTMELDASRPEGASVAYTLHFPKTFTAELGGCEITLPAPWAGTYRVLGNPGAYMDINTPTPWNRPVEIERAYG